MKKIFMSAAAAVLCLCAASCTNEVPDEGVKDSQVEEISVSPSELTEAVLAEIPINSAFEKSIDDIPFYFSELDTSTVSEVSYYICASGAYPDEIAVITFNSAESALQGSEAVHARLDKQISVYESYTPDEMYKLDTAVIDVKGNAVIYLVTSDNERAKEIIDGIIG